MALTASEKAYAAWIARLIEESGSGDAFSNAIECGDTVTVQRVIANFSEMVQHKSDQIQTRLMASTEDRQKFNALMWDQLNDINAPFVPHGWKEVEADPEVKARLKAEAEQKFAFLQD